MSDVLIRCENVGKVFCRDLKRSLWYGVRDIATDLMLGHRDSFPRHSAGIQLRPQEFWANRDVSFEVRRGECLGVIGRNGAGKTTLLKMLNGLIKPDVGRIELHGTTGALIALGAGFNPILTGRENVYVNGSVLGLSRRQIDDRFEEIVDFSELSKSINTPVRNFSSGMQVRLGFAVAAVLLQPDVLLLDEVLAVGDMGFKMKCFNRVCELAKTSAVVLVSHTMQQIGTFCNRACVMQDGTIAEDSTDVIRAIAVYNQLFDLDTQQRISGNGAARLRSVELLPSDTLMQSSLDVYATRSTLRLNVSFDVVSAGEFSAVLGVVTAGDEALAFMPCTDASGESLIFTEGTHNICAALPFGDLVMGRYYVYFIVRDQYRQISLRVDRLASFQVTAEDCPWGRIVRSAVTERVQT